MESGVSFLFCGHCGHELPKSQDGVPVHHGCEKQRAALEAHRCLVEAEDAAHEAQEAQEAEGEDVTQPAPHPAKFSDPLIPLIAEQVKGCQLLLDPFAGVGKIALVKSFGFDGKVFCNELEPEWADQALACGADRVLVGDCRKLEKRYAERFDAIATSPCYGNRMADHHDATDDSVRITYTHKLGRKLTEGSSGVLKWGKAYRDFHLEAWTSILKCLTSGGLFVLNISDHIRGGEVMPVTRWHVLVLQGLGLVVVDWTKVETRRMRRGENHELRVEHESLITFQKVDLKTLGS